MEHSCLIAWAQQLLLHPSSLQTQLREFSRDVGPPDREVRGTQPRTNEFHYQANSIFLRVFSLLQLPEESHFLFRLDFSRTWSTALHTGLVDGWYSWVQDTLRLTKVRCQVFFKPPAGHSERQAELLAIFATPQEWLLACLSPFPTWACYLSPSPCSSDSHNSLTEPPVTLIMFLGVESV